MWPCQAPLLQRAPTLVVYAYSAGACGGLAALEMRLRMLILSSYAGSFHLRCRPAVSNFSMLLLLPAVDSEQQRSLAYFLAHGVEQHSWLTYRIVIASGPGVLVGGLAGWLDW